MAQIAGMLIASILFVATMGLLGLWAWRKDRAEEATELLETGTFQGQPSDLKKAA